MPFGDQLDVRTRTIIITRIFEDNRTSFV